MWGWLELEVAGQAEEGDLPGREEAAEALELIDQLIAMGSPESDLWLRASAAARAGRVDAAWASLNSLAMAMARSSNPSGLARRGLFLAERLPPRSGSEITLRRLRVQARGY